ncbi:Dynein regulatory complex subunit 4 [Chamberlinius hualienensis]
MPPSKSKDKGTKPSGSKKMGKEKSSVLIDGLPISTMSRDQLEGHVIRLRSELDKEREERNYFQLERDKLQAFWEVTRSQLEKKKIELRNNDRMLEETEERHLGDRSLLNQKMKHLMFENQNKLTLAKTENLGFLKTEQQSHEQREKQLLEGNNNLMKQLREQELSSLDLIQKMRLKHSEKLAKTRLQFETQVNEIENKYQERFKLAEREMKAKYELELQEMEERKNHHSENLIKNHEKALMNMKNYYNDITVNNMTLITTLKEQLVTRTNKESQLEKRVEQLTVENKKVNTSLQHAQLQIKDWEKQIKIFNKDKDILNNTKRQLQTANEEIKNVQWQLEVIQQSFIKLEKERDELHEKFVSAIQEVQQKSSLKNMLLEKKWQTLEGLLEARETNFPANKPVNPNESENV